MEAIRKFLASEPAVIVGFIVSCLSLAGVTLGETDAEALTQVVSFAVPILGSLIVRANVTPTSKVDGVGPHGVNPELIDDGDIR